MSSKLALSWNSIHSSKRPNYSLSYQHEYQNEYQHYINLMTCQKKGDGPIPKEVIQSVGMSGFKTRCSGLLHSADLRVQTFLLITFIHLIWNHINIPLFKSLCHFASNMDIPCFINYCSNQQILFSCSKDQVTKTSTSR